MNIQKTKVPVRPGFDETDERIEPRLTATASKPGKF